ncbi:probable 4-coumarate--CoA ligase 3 [Agrilus planipennis]|uniref:Probable 4-coumarate--CoA ligase 3 n=1 Tax=Agrilus planipennis TaxID=224129 RepID=A0A7F5R2U8_AGRPL|nr:probable 4-coumarate--CoA ligase 3 [Agrilus planipennis]
MFQVASDATKLSKKNIPIITIKTQVSESTERGSINFTELTDIKYDNDDFIFPKIDDIAVMPYSSGTTGLPKGVELTHRNLVSNITQISNFNLHIPTTETYQEAIPAVLPMFHIYGHTNLTLYPLHFGMKIVTLPKFTPELFTSVLEEHNPGLLFIVPPIVNFMNTTNMIKKECYKSLRSVFCGAAPLGPLDEAKFVEKAGKDVNMLQGYGLTETSPVVSTLSIERKKEFNVMGSVGDPVPNTLVKIVSPDDPTGKLLKPKEKGELLVKGPQVMKGYHNKPEETANMVDDGWLRTGDLAYYDENNFIFVTDRMKELIKVKGFQVAPAELEELIRDHPQVEDAAVIGIPHENYGEVPRAYVIPKKGAKIDAEKLNEYLTPKVTSYKLLRGGVSVVDSIPKNAAGKILRRNLKKLYEELKI